LHLHRENKPPHLLESYLMEYPRSDEKNIS
jgi:hypothetical protein